MNMHDETIRHWCHNEMRAPAGSEIYRRAKAILALVDNAVAPPWLADAAVALGKVRPIDDAPLALNWNQVLQEIRELRDERDHWKANCESWHMVYNAWQDWSSELLHERGLRPADACSHGDGAARDIIADLVRLAPMLPYGAEAIPLCERCSHKATDHEVDDEERRACLAFSCACEQFEAPL